MLRSNLSLIKPLLTSEDGIHITAYVENTGSLKQMRIQIDDAIHLAHESLATVLRPEDVKKLMSPILNLKRNPILLKRFRGNLGIFRTPESFRVLNIPVPVEQICVVATSFHVKPLLRWMQNNPEYILLGLEPGQATLYHGTQNTLEISETILLPAYTSAKIGSDDGSYESLKNSRRKNFISDTAVVWLNVWLKQMTKMHSPRLYLAGDRNYTDMLFENLEYTNIYPKAISHHFSQKRAADISGEIQNIIRNETKQKLKEAILEYHWAEEKNMARKNIFHIAKSAALGQIKKLIVADDINIFGKINKKSGDLKIHPIHLDHEDDDILDDLAQTVIASGGEVIIAPRDQIPKGRPALAIINPLTERSIYAANNF